MSLPPLRAPTEHGAILAVPPLDQVGALLDRNARNLYSGSRIISRGAWFYQWRALARREVLAASDAYHHEAGEQIPDSKSDCWLVAGHQPELFHPGVWFKNFALHQLARAHGAMSLNLIVDTDAAKPALLHAPADGRRARLPFDRSNTETQYEERQVEDESIFADLPQRIAPVFSEWGFEPMLVSFWGEVMQQAARTPLLGERFAAARRAMERRWGVAQRELPMSRVCRTKAFAYFACSIVNEMPAFHALYNQIVRAYRQTHGIRSRNHPVPDLQTDGDWLEAPFWAWRHGQARRGRLFVRRSGDRWLLRVSGEDWPSVPYEFESMAEAWHALEAQSFKIRSRALTTTLFARLFLADLFIHGIGGGLYDELTDQLIEGYIKIHSQPVFAPTAPEYLVLSATLLLPLPRFPDAAQAVRRLQRERRDFIFKPECAVAITEATRSLIAAKQEWITRSVASHAERAERFRRIRDINTQLSPFVLQPLRRLQLELAEQERRAEWDAVASRRDYAFCLYPEEMLRTFFSAPLNL